MSETEIQYSKTRDLPLEAVLRLYRGNGWSAADKPELLQKALLGSHSLITAWDGQELVGLANAITDGYLVVYYPHLLVLPEYQRRGIGRRLMVKYHGFHQHILVAEHGAVEFYRRIGFKRAGQTEPMEVYDGDDH